MKWLDQLPMGTIYGTIKEYEINSSARTAMTAILKNALSLSENTC
ncbi:hypothetical protein C7374_10869 [Falsochrobactrum ovis]|uniref:Uncharacterized protein n=1 Tax=Falsochrobactrum ovis TaxID=1293442 RepID=A0A364JUE7_9HYPH|nr:hypothetical protein C7374_10869 [Falsochrobactrum ovis]